MNKQLIYGDIGGTKTILQLAEIRDGEIHQQFSQRYDSAAFVTFSDMLRDFLNRTETANHPVAACFAIAGPIVAQQTKVTNLPWQISSAGVSAEFSIPAVKLINDFEAAALAIESLSPNDWVTLQTGQGQGQAHAQAMRVVLGAGTGMGVAWLPWLEGRYFALPTEAGHMDFAPANELQTHLFKALHHQFGHVSVERLLSGSGLTNIFNFLQMNAAIASDLAPVNLEEDSGATITALAQTRKHPIAIKSLNLFAEIYGAYAGNLALAGLCRGGVYIAGGIAPRIIDILSLGGFMRAFRDKGRFSALMHEIPVHVITNYEISLLGAKQEAHNLLNSQD
ncbi:glucokinase [Nitrosomonas sp.]|uniref:glucokinase n=1 Tax=Nitrosomonas sp. TaxID=42353 RepID=UPI0025D2767F|nr:glucokinase [Nitrosomonas sp.]MBY0483913.1 glucokinase [Nitrosomonas sp.]